MRTDSLTRAEQNKLLDIVFSLPSCRDFNSLRTIVDKFIDLVGCEHLIFGVPNDAYDEGLGFTDVNISYPKDWVDLYRKKRYWEIDPIIHAAMRQSGVHFWGDVYNQDSTDEEFLEVSRGYGLKNGYTCLVRDVYEQSGLILSLAGPYEKYDLKTAYIVEKITPCLSQALDTIRRLREAKKINALTKKEKEVLKWLYDGKTSWEIAIILNVSESTINFHISNIKSKLKVVSRCQAVAKAVHGGLVGL
jgi:LuxR family transcriptional regulator, quorum-sensing system regulator CviR